MRFKDGLPHGVDELDMNQTFSVFAHSLTLPFWLKQPRHGTLKGESQLFTCMELEIWESSKKEL